ncbi:hypothetical protein ACFXG4_27205 [Nocardia sp. NPDC059246]|uniref:hypothetical protein n=1 Tax=unclassified Nocardia TaxID=2637762 RepID=UPI00367539A4
MPEAEVARIVVRRYFDADGAQQIDVEAVDATGDDLTLLEALGLLEIAKVELAANAVLSMTRDP